MKKYQNNFYILAIHTGACFAASSVYLVSYVLAILGNIAGHGPRIIDGNALFVGCFLGLIIGGLSSTLIYSKMKNPRTLLFLTSGWLVWAFAVFFLAKLSFNEYSIYVFLIAILGITLINTLSIKFSKIFKND